MDNNDDNDDIGDAATSRIDPPRGGPPRSATAKLGSFDGATTPLETHLSRFETHSRFFKWSEEERLFHLSSSLIKDAGNILWDGSACGSSAALIRLLKNRFGVQNQSEKFQIELKMRRRKPNETMQAIYQDIKRLVALAYPGDTGRVIDRISIDAFTDALDDQAFRIKILEREPKTLD